jgi:hypothetical protein
VKENQNLHAQSGPQSTGPPSQNQHYTRSEVDPTKKKQKYPSNHFTTQIRRRCRGSQTPRHREGLDFASSPEKTSRDGMVRAKPSENFKKTSSCKIEVEKKEDLKPSQTTKEAPSRSEETDRE